MIVQALLFSMKNFIFFIIFSASFPLPVFCQCPINGGFLCPDKPTSHPDTILSADGTFELGFFSPGNNENYYLGIRYASIAEKDIVWIENRDYPFRISATLSISSDGNIVITDEKLLYKVSNSSKSSNTSALLLDSGNFILRDATTDQVLWQSFDYPTNTLLPGMSLGYDDNSTRTEISQEVVSWKSAEDPSPGNFSLQADSSGLLIIKKGNKTYWNSTTQGVPKDQSWNRNLKQTGNSSNHRGFLTYYPVVKEISRIMLDVSGQLKHEMWSEDKNQWISLLKPTCGFHSCGAFSSCNENAKSLCDCLFGFTPQSPDAWKIEDRTHGCERKTNLNCGNNNNNNSEKDEFLQMSNVSFPSDYIKLPVKSSEECKSACSSNCSCIAYALDANQGCLVWDQDLFDLKITLNDEHDITDFYLKLAASEIGNSVTTDEKGDAKSDSGSKMQRWTIVILAVSLGTLALGLLIHQAHRKLRRKGEDLLLFDLGMNLRDDSLEPSQDDKVKKLKKREVKLPLFSFKSVAAATDNFSDGNKLGEGGFGPVYKGKLRNGEEIAVKRLSRRSGQGFEELRNEATLIAKLQHSNLVRIWGCCIEKDEKILIYEYMPNKSLDFFLFETDTTKRRMLDWTTRVRIIDGVAQGLLYLHQYSRLRIIHRDLKASNILLDKDMNPKISDFGMARICGGNDLQANTNRIVGTYGYMSPEYALEGLFSVKSDVFSFGVLLLEIVTGKRNTGLYQAKSLNLLRYTWEFWTTERGINLMDPALETDPSTSPQMLLKYVQVALLCVQENAADRPTMSDIVSMLSNESTSLLPSPKPPAYSNVTSMKSSRSLLNSGDSVNNVTVTVFEGR